MLLRAVSDRSERARPRIDDGGLTGGRDLDLAGAGFAPSFQVLHLLDGEESSMRVLCRLPAPVLASTLLAAAPALALIWSACRYVSV